VRSPIPAKDIEAKRLQYEYYTKTAADYDSAHSGDREHELAMGFMLGMIDYFRIETILDVGAGTGRLIEFLNTRNPEIQVCGIEPVENLRKIGYSKGISRECLVDGDALAIKYDKDSFDLVCAFAMLHHVGTPEIVLGEMLRVARVAIFLSDSNNYGQGPRHMRAIKQALRTLGLWRVANRIKTKGKGYTCTDGDGVAYSYSIFDNYSWLKSSCSSVHLLNTASSGPNLYRTAGHVALLGIL